MNDTNDWFDVEKLSIDSWRLSEATFFNDYLLTGEDQAVLLDASVGVGDLRSVVEGLTDVPLTVVLTHSHWDHIGAAHQFDDVRIHEAELSPDGTVRWDYIADKFHIDLDGWMNSWLERGNEFPDSFDPEAYEIQPATDVKTVEEKEIIDLGGRELEFIHLPGHAPGQLGAIDRDRGDLYGGDVIHIHQNLYIHFDGCDIHDYIDTFERLRELRDGGVFDTLYTAHNPPIFGDELSILDEYHEGLQAILADELPHEPNNDTPPGRVYEIAGNEIVTKPDVS